MFEPRISRFSLTKPETCFIATARLRSDAASSVRSPASISETEASDWLNCRTVLSLRASVRISPSRASAEPNSSSLLSSSVPVSWLKSSMVWWNLAPWPPKLAAVVSSRSVSAPLAFAPLGPRATVRSSRLW